MSLLINPYSIREGVVFWGQDPVPKAEAAHFQHLGGHWARDAERIFAGGRVKKVDVASFQFLNPVFVKDLSAVYDSEGPIKNADAESFEVLDSGLCVNDEIITAFSVCGYARDRNFVFYHDQGVGRATVLRGADPKSFVSLRNNFGCDSNGVWIGKERLLKADPASWAHLGFNWSADRQRVYYAEREVPGINRESFTIVAAPGLKLFATDCDKFFMAEHQISAQEFWANVAESTQSLEQYFRAGYNRLRGTCKTCDGTGKCYCLRKGLDSGTCARCRGTEECHLCKGRGRVQRSWLP